MANTVDDEAGTDASRTGDFVAIVESTDNADDEAESDGLIVTLENSDTTDALGIDGCATEVTEVAAVNGAAKVVCALVFEEVIGRAGGPSATGGAVGSQAFAVVVVDEVVSVGSATCRPADKNPRSIPIPTVGRSSK